MGCGIITLLLGVADGFDILSLPARFDLDLDQVAAAYLATAALQHPDLASGDDAGRAMAVINDARRQLENPESRADVLLRRLGGPGASDERTLPAAFLAEMLEVREEIEAATADPAGRPQARAQWEGWARDRRAETVRDIASQFAALPPTDAVASRAAALRQIRIRLNQWRYVERLIEQLDPAYDGRAGS